MLCLRRGRSHYNTSERIESLGVIDEPTPWCAGMVAVPKKNDTIHVCVDLRPLNENVIREVHPLSFSPIHYSILLN